MERTLKILNELESQGLFQRYALGGAVAALFYIAPFETEDLDVFVILPEKAHPLMPLSPFYEELRRQGFKEDGPYVIIEGVDVQFLPAYNDLVKEAVAEAREVPYESTTTRIPSAEHLAAIMLQTGRDKDRIRFDRVREQAELDEARLADILSRHGLEEKYLSWTQ